jgi:Leucine-rich repeat (LRR) protein
LIKLQTINLSENVVVDLTPLVNLQNLKNLDFVDNPIDLSEGSAQQTVLSELAGTMMCTGKVGHEILSKGESKHDKKTL